MLGIAAGAERRVLWPKDQLAVPLTLVVRLPTSDENKVGKKKKENKRQKGKRKKIIKALVRVLSFPFPHITSSRQAIKQRKKKEREKDFSPSDTEI